MSKKVSPISPEEAKQSQVIDLPDEVIAAWNKIIVRKLQDGTAIVYQHEIVKDISLVMHCNSEKVFANKWLDIESLYKKSGWVVQYDKPAYNETYEAFFTFKPKKGLL